MTEAQRKAQKKAKKAAVKSLEEMKKGSSAPNLSLLDSYCFLLLDSYCTLSCVHTPICKSLDNHMILLASILGSGAWNTRHLLSCLHFDGLAQVLSLILLFIFLYSHV